MGNKNKILVVEDSPLFARIVTNKLKEEFKYEIVCETNLKDARVTVQLVGHEIFLALLDLRLPDALDGEIVDFVLKNKIPVIVLTGESDEKVRELIWSKNVIDYVQKENPESLDYVCAMIRRLERNSSIKTLVVDDSRSMRAIISRLLRTHQYQVLEAENGGQALEVLSEHPEISLVITDYNMPEMDGFELSRRIRKKKSKDHLAIIGVSGLGESNISARFLKNGANDFISKPFANEEFNCRVTYNVEMIEQVQTLRELNAVKNKFLGIAAHDLRNPLSTIQGFSQILLEEEAGPMNEDQKEFSSLILKSSRNMLSLVNELLDVSVIESGKLEVELKEGSLEELIEERVRVSQAAANKKKLTLSINLPEKQRSVFFDELRITQVLDNLISNAIKFSPSGKSIFVSLEYPGVEARICVRDEGPGLSDEDKTMLFGEFQKLSARPTGGEASTGLGLSIVKKIVEAHRGRVWVESSPGEGASFIFSLPCREMIPKTSFLRGSL